MDLVDMGLRFGAHVRRTFEKLAREKPY
jgi:hypothetical protein